MAFGSRTATSTSVATQAGKKADAAPTPASLRTYRGIWVARYSHKRSPELAIASGLTNRYVASSKADFHIGEAT